MFTINIWTAPFLDMGRLTAHRTTKSLGCQVLGTGVTHVAPVAAHLTLKEPGPPVSERSTFITIVVCSSRTPLGRTAVAPSTGRGLFARHVTNPSACHPAAHLGHPLGLCILFSTCLVKCGRHRLPIWIKNDCKLHPVAHLSHPLGSCILFSSCLVGCARQELPVWVKGGKT